MYSPYYYDAILLSLNKLGYILLKSKKMFSKSFDYQQIWYIFIFHLHLTWKKVPDSERKGSILEHKELTSKLFIVDSLDFGLLFSFPSRVVPTLPFPWKDNMSVRFMTC